VLRRISASIPSVIMARGTGLIAGSPGAIGRPGFVTVPTPSPARKTMPVPGDARATRATMVAPWVTSGSSPASLTMPASAKSAPSVSRASAKAGVSPFGRVMVTGSGKRPVSSAVSAALVAAVAQAPVVQPRRSGPDGLRPVFGDFGFDP
jgi:hypothetical protein